MLEDDPDDAELIQQVIVRAKIECEFEVVHERTGFLDAIREFQPDIILSDNQLPQFDATEALELTRAHSLYLPFIMITGTVSEEFAANVIRMGADDYILKDRMARLPAAITAAIERRTAEAAIINERKKAEQEILYMNEQLRLLTNHLQNIREEESTRIAREIHDQLGQQLTVMKMDASWIAKRLKEKDPESFARAEGLMKMIDDTVKTVRRIAGDLRPFLLDDMGLVPAVEHYLHEFGERSGIRVAASIPKDDIELPEDIKSGLFRIFQEALTNVARHAQATQLSVTIETENNNLNIIIADNGIGFETKEITGKKSFGILGIKERVAMMKGSHSIKSSPGKGTRLTVSVPLSPVKSSGVPA